VANFLKSKVWDKDSEESTVILEIGLLEFSYNTVYDKLKKTSNLTHVGFDRTQNIISFRYHIGLFS